MRFLGVLGAFLVLGLLNAAAEPAEAVPVPKIRLEPAEIRLVCKRGIDPVPTQVSFTVTNDSAAPLHIDRVTASCGCSQPRAEQSDIGPGGSTHVVVDLNPNVYKNDREAIVRVSSNDPAQPMLAVPISVHWLEPVTVEPQSGILSLGRVPCGESGQAEGLLLQQFGDAPLALKELRYNRDLFTVEALPEEEEGRTRVRIRVLLKPQAVAGAFDELLEVESNASSSRHTFHVVGTVEGALVVAPQRLTLTRVAAGGKTERTFIVAARPPTQRRLAKVVSSSPAFATEVTEQEGRWRVTLTYTAPPAAGLISEYLDFVDDEGGITRVPCKGSVFAPYVPAPSTP